MARDQRLRNYDAGALPRAILQGAGLMSTKCGFRLRHDLSLRAISASLAEQDYLNQRGKPFAAKSVAVMLGERSSELHGDDSAWGRPFRTGIRT